MVGIVNYGSLPFEEQIAYFRNKVNVPTERWADMWKQAHDRSFIVAGAMKDDLLADFRLAVDKAISEGKSLNWFKSEFKHIVAKHGWEHNGHANWRSQVIYETNLRQSYTAGREQQIEQIKHRRPYGIYKHSGSEHPRHDHLSWNNMVLPLDDPWWKTHTPINGFGCKCKKLTASKRTLDRLGLEVSQAPKIEHYDWVDKVTGEVHRVPKGVDPGFDYTPKSSAELTEKTKTLIQAKPPLEERLPTRAVESAFSTVKGVNASEISRVLEQAASPQLTAFTEFLSKHEVKTLVLKQSELTGKAKGRALVEPIEEYLKSGQRAPILNFFHRNATRTNGFTSRHWNHVVVKAKSTDTLKRVTAEQLREAMERAMALSATSQQYSLSTIVKAMYGDSARVLNTWAHEMGHQIHFKAGSPAAPVAYGITQYSEQNEFEWFAEHFVAWLFAPEALNDRYPEVFSFITDTVNKTI
ncbi:F protein [Vibrio parahaemolyticus]|uniref:phage minor head protein n=1 Tax=Vibrio parahaemolyticus TaxID=670 RepID=UPI00193ECDB4|nr:phage minor head protein [Vibrio parahaemolyticus]MBM4916946.1 F protein [Vibrio parahaemolyticus]MCX8922535.1 phage minor head protein [Vibrio parahaemolyticus]HCG8184419.1 F protein [Vibrio parahaemolyticus]